MKTSASFALLLLAGCVRAQAADRLTEKIAAYSERQHAEDEPSTAFLKAWPSKTGSQAGAVLIDTDIGVRNNSSQTLDSADLVFKADDPPVSERFSLGDQGESERLFLLALPPGDYQTTLELTTVGQKESREVLGRFSGFTVKTGQVTVLGSAEFAVHMDDQGLEILDPKYDGKAETRARLLKGAVAKAESACPAWSEALKAALKSVEGELPKASSSNNQ